MFKKICAFILSASVLSTTAFASGNIRILEELNSGYDVSLQEITQGCEYTSDVIAIVNDASEEYLKSIPNVIKTRKISDDVYVFTFEDVKTAIVMAKYLNSDPNIKKAAVDTAYEFYDDEGIFSDDKDSFADDESDSALLLELGEGSTLESGYPNDYSRYEGQWYLDEVNAKQSWDELESIGIPSDRQAVVAVIDTGCNIYNEDMKNRILTDSNGNYVTYNAAIQSTTPSDVVHTGSNSTHGTKVASIIAAEADNDYGICGVAGKSNVRILPIKVQDSSNLIKQTYLTYAMEYAISKKVDVINISLSINSPENVLEDLIKKAYDAGITVVCAGGNSYSTKYVYPGASFYSLSVGATTPSRQKASFSQYNDMIDIAAPGQSLTLISSDTITHANNGTSFSSPIVAATAALVKLANPDITPKGTFDVLKLSAVDLGTEGYDIEYGYGLVDAKEAVKNARYGHVEVKNFTYTKSRDIMVGSSFQIETEITPINADNQTIKFFSSDTSIATVSGNGVVYGVKPGVAYISLVVDDSYDLSFDEDGVSLLYCRVKVYPDSIDFVPTSAVIGSGTVQSPPVTDYDKFYMLGSDSIYRMRINETTGGTSIAAVKSITSPYKFVEYLPKNVGTERSDVSYILVSDNGNIYTSSTETFSSIKAFPKPDYWNNANKYIAVASDGASFTLIDNNGYFHNYNVYDENHTKNARASYQLTNQYNDIKYVSDENSYMYIAVGYTEKNECVISYSNYGSKEWKTAVIGSLPVFKQILTDGQVCYLLSDDAVYALKAFRVYNAETNTNDMKVSMPQKYVDIDSSKITKIGSYSDAGANIIVGFGGDNNVYSLTNNGPEVIHTFDGKKVEQLFAYNNTCWAIVDGVLQKGGFEKAKSKSITDELKIYDVNVLDKDKKLVSSVPEDGKFYTEYFMECDKEISFTHEKSDPSNSATQVKDNKYPVQIVTAVYEKATNRLVSVKTKNFIIEYGEAGSIFKWIEDFDLPSGEYIVKTMTFKGNNFYWPEKGNASKTLDIFSYTFEK